MEITFVIRLALQFPVNQLLTKSCCSDVIEQWMNVAETRIETYSFQFLGVEVVYGDGVLGPMAEALGAIQKASTAGKKTLRRRCS